MDLTQVSVTATLDVPVGRLWDVVSRTDRYAEWVVGVLEVTDHHGDAVVGGVYRERNRTIGPLTTRSEWTVRHVDPRRRRVDTGTGFAPLHELTNVFEFVPDGERTVMTYAVRYRVGLGALGPLVDRAQRPGLRANFARSLRNLRDVVVAEGL